MRKRRPKINPTLKERIVFGKAEAYSVEEEVKIELDTDIKPPLEFSWGQVTKHMSKPIIANVYPV